MPPKVVIVTGASRGIGKSITQFLYRPLQQCNVVAVARSEEALKELKSQGEGRVEIVSGDFSDLSLGQKAVDLAISKFGQLDGIVINHGRVEPVARLVDLNMDEYKKTFDINVFSALALIQAALPELRKTKGRIVLTSSGAAVKGTSTWGAYCPSKACLNSLAQVLAAEEPSITSIAIRPGVVATEMQELLSTKYELMDKVDAEKFGTMRQQGTMLKPEQPGNVMARLVLDAPNELNGKFLNWNDDSLKQFQDI